MALALRKEEGLGLGIAIVAHAAIVAVLLLRPHNAPVVQPPERIEVTISDEVGLKSTSPQPNSQAAAVIAPELGEPQPPVEPAPPEPAPPEPSPPQPAPVLPKPAPPKPTPPQRKPEPAPRPVPKPAPRPAERPKPQPRETARPAPPKPAPKAPAAKPATKAPAAKPATKAPATKATGTSGASTKAQAKPATKSGGDRIGANFLDGITGGNSTNRIVANPPAKTMGPEVRASLASAISRRLKPKWQAPQGPEAEDLVTILSFNLNRDGTLAGTPQVVRQLGINDINRNQAARHAEQAVRAVRLAAPFDLPGEYYDAWKRVSAFRFDKRLSQ